MQHEFNEFEERDGVHLISVDLFISFSNLPAFKSYPTCIISRLHESVRLQAQPGKSEDSFQFEVWKTTYNFANSSGPDSSLHIEISADPSDGLWIGSTDVPLVALICDKNMQYESALKVDGNWTQCRFKIRASIRRRASSFAFKFSAQSLPKMDLSGYIDAYFKIKSFDPDTGELTTRHISELVHNANPQWDFCQGINLDDLCGNDLYRPIIIEVWDFDQQSAHDVVGWCQTSVNEMMNVSKVCLYNDDFDDVRGYFLFHGDGAPPKLDKAWTIADYLQQGLSFNYHFGFDFSGANMTQFGSNHASPDNAMNPYFQILQTLQGVLPYRVDEFKAKRYGVGQTGTSLFQNNSANQWSEMIQAYVNEASLYDPNAPRGTTLTPLVNEVSQSIEKTMQGYSDGLHQPDFYGILFLFVCDSIKDAHQLSNKLNEISARRKPIPLTVYIIDVGDGANNKAQLEYFSEKNAGKRSHVYRHIPRNSWHEMQNFIQKDLEMLPKEILEYMGKKAITPEALGAFQSNIDTLRINVTSRTNPLHEKV